MKGVTEFLSTVIVRLTKLSARQNLQTVQMCSRSRKPGSAQPCPRRKSYCFLLLWIVAGWMAASINYVFPLGSAADYAPQPLFMLVILFALISLIHGAFQKYLITEWLSVVSDGWLLMSLAGGALSVTVIVIITGNITGSQPAVTASAYNSTVVLVSYALCISGMQWLSLRKVVSNSWLFIAATVNRRPCDGISHSGDRTDRGQQGAAGTGNIYCTGYSVGCHRCGAGDTDQSAGPEEEKLPPCKPSCQSERIQT